MGDQLGALAHAWVTRRSRAGLISRKTAIGQRQVVAAFATAMGGRRAAQIGASDIEHWMASLAHMSAGTRRNYFCTVRAFLDDLVDNDHMRKNPARRVKAPRIPRSVHRAFDRDQIAALVAACPDERALCFVLFGLQTGVRRAEMAGIQIGDVNRMARTVTVTGKGGHQRTIPIPDEAMAAYVRYLTASPASSGPLIRQDRYPNQGVSPGWLGEQFVAIAYAAGVKRHPHDGVGYHACRHTAATDIYLACKDVVIVRDVLGHASLSTTQIYVAGMDLSAMRDAMEGRNYRSGPPEAA